MPPKRKRSPTTYNNVGSSKSSNQRPAKTQSKGKTSVKKTEESDWPAFFQDATIQSVQTFCSSRKHLAITFSIVRKSVENILKRPLELERVAQIKALLPDIVQFAYFSEADIRINADTMEKDGSLDIYAPRNFSGASDGEEYVLVLDFVENGKGRGTQTIHPQGVGYALPVALSPTALKQLIERRNERFCTAVNELIAASAISSEDPVILVSNAAHGHLPVDPSSILREAQSSPSSRRAPVIPTPMDRPSIESIIEELKESQEKGFEYRAQIVYERVFEQRESRWGELSRPLSKNMAKALQATRGVTGFYTHQAAAINSIWDRKNVIVSTSTASGKSIIYQLPTLCALEKDRSVTAIFIYPTKALAQDQKLAIEQLLLQCPGLEGVKVATYDGDTPQDLRNTIRQTASIIFTNFDMLHAAILPYEENWRRFFKSLHLVVVDELHYYTGAFGSHVAMIMRRLRRVCAANGNQDTLFVSCSATIANPRRHMEDVFGVENIEVVTDDGAPAGQKHFLLWNPPNVDPLDPSAGRISSISEAGWLFKTLIKQGIRTIVFCKIRRTCETLMKNVRAELTSEGRLDVLSKVKAYRGGYSQNDRRQIEHEAFSGNLLGIIATNALELGVDIGTLDAVIILGFPSGLASLLQQMGRAGRRARDALSIMVAANKGIDQHYVEHPDELFSKNIEELHVDLDNQVLLESHLQCAAHEMPIHEVHDQLYFGPSLPSLCTSSLKRDNDGWYHTNPKFLPSPSKFISIRGIQEVKYAVIDITHFEKSGGQAKILEEIEFSRAIFELYEGGVFMHQGQTYVIQEVSHDQKLARLVRSDVNWYTRPEEVIPNQTHRIRAVRKSAQRAFYGTVYVSIQVTGFKKIRQGTCFTSILLCSNALATRNGVILDMVSLETPPYERMTTGMWMDIPKPIIGLLQAKGIYPETAMYAAQQAMLNHTHLANDMKILNVVPPSAKADPQRKPIRKRPARLIFYDAAGEGSGVCVKGFEQITTLLWSAYEALEACSCQNGCPSCIRGARHTEENDGSSKVGACLVLRGLLDIAIDPDTVPNFGTLDVPGTVVEADSVRAVRGVKVESLE